MLYDCIQQLGRQNKKAPSVAVARRHANAWKDHANGRRHNDVSVELCLSCCEFGVFRAKDCLTFICFSCYCSNQLLIVPFRWLKVNYDNKLSSFEQFVKLKLRLCVTFPGINVPANECDRRTFLYYPYRIGESFTKRGRKSDYFGEAQCAS